MDLRVPAFRRLYEVEQIAGVGTFLLTETAPTVLNGRLNELVCSMINGERSSDEIARALSNVISPAETFYTINVLHQRGFLEEAHCEVPLAKAAYWQAIGVDPVEAVRRLRLNPVEVIVSADAPRECLTEALEALGVAQQAGSRLKIAVVTDYRDSMLGGLDHEAIDQRTSWVIVKPVGTIAWIGPFFSPSVKGCWSCLAERIRMNMPVESFIEEQRPRTGAPRTSRASLPTTIGTACQLAATEIAKWIVRGGESSLNGVVMTLNTLTLRIDHHKLAWRPQCKVCGNPEYRAGTTHKAKPKPIQFQSRRRLRNLEGGHRTCTSAETLQKYEHHVSPITGVVSHLERVSPAGSTVIHAYAASHNWATHPDSLAFLKRSLRSRSGGKGQTDLQAKAGAIAEAFERYSGVYRGDEIRRRATYSQMGPEVLHPYSCMLFSEAQYQRREEINQQGNAFQMVPFPFQEDAETDWTPMWSPTAGEFFWVPTGYLYYSYAKSVPAADPNRLAFYADSNGCAAGNTHEEAALQALLECAERDAVATWWYSRVRRPEVNLKEIDEPFLVDMENYLEQARRDLWVLDITNDLGIPVFAAFSRLLEPIGKSEQVVVGFGAHLEPRIGILRAITEVNQFFASLQALDDDGLAKAFDPGAVEWWRTSTREKHPYIQPATDLSRKSLSEYPDLTSDDLLDELNTVIRLIETQGMRVLLLDQTRPDLGFPVIKAVVPGMRHFWARLAPGRLYDVPLKLGWLSKRLGESELNPVPVFF